MRPDVAVEASSIRAHNPRTECRKCRYLNHGGESHYKQASIIIISITDGVRNRAPNAPSYHESAMMSSATSCVASGRVITTCGACVDASPAPNLGIAGLESAAGGVAHQRQTFPLPGQVTARRLQGGFLGHVYSVQLPIRSSMSSSFLLFFGQLFRKQAFTASPASIGLRQRLENQGLEPPKSKPRASKIEPGALQDAIFKES